MFGTWRIYDFPFSWEWNNIPTVTHSIIFQRGRYTTNQMNTWYYPYVNHGAGILTYKTGWFLGQMLVCIFQHHGSHMGYWDGAENSDSSFWLLEFAHFEGSPGYQGVDADQVSFLQPLDVVVAAGPIFWDAAVPQEDKVMVMRCPHFLGPSAHSRTQQNAENTDPTRSNKIKRDHGYIMDVFYKVCYGYSMIFS